MRILRIGVRRRRFLLGGGGGGREEGGMGKLFLEEIGIHQPKFKIKCKVDRTAKIILLPNISVTQY